MQKLQRIGAYGRIFCSGIWEWTTLQGTRFDYLRLQRTALKTRLFQMSRFKGHAIHRLFKYFHPISRKPSLVFGQADSRSLFSTLSTSSKLAVVPVLYVQWPQDQTCLAQRNIRCRVRQPWNVEKSKSTIFNQAYYVENKREALSRFLDHNISFRDEKTSLPWIYACSIVFVSSNWYYHSAIT